ncbi:MAG: cell division protein ZapA [Prevotellaceae bacterium]|jgi:cell division protein ZapA|nr:cell division protein ZapA [Prevotellaceae bacterium]
MKKDSLTIRVSIADKFYPLDIKLEKEEKIRKAAKLINDKILQIRTHSNSKLETVDYLAMVALQLATSFLELSEQKDVEILTQKLESVNQELEQFLKLN